MSDQLYVHNWDQWQSYRSDRGVPPWIKVHRRLMHDPNWVRLSDAQKGHLVSIWILAADRDGAIPADSKMIQRLCCLEHEPDLASLISLGFLSKARNDLDVAPTDPNETGKIYFIRYQDTIKVGFSKNPWARLDALKTAMPFEPELVGHMVATKADEKRLQELLSDHKTSREWFKETAEVRQCMDYCLTTGRLPDALPCELPAAQKQNRVEKRRKEEGAKAPYAFKGKIIKLTEANLSEWVNAYAHLDLKAELIARDAWLAEDSARQTNWFVSTSKYLANRNMEARAKQIGKKPAVYASPQFKDAGPEPEKPSVEEREAQVARLLKRTAASLKAPLPAVHRSSA